MCQRRPAAGGRPKALPSEAIVVAVGCLAAPGLLSESVLTGSRIPSMMHSDAAWRTGHEAGSALTLAGFGLVVFAAIVATKRPGPDIQTALFRIAKGWLLA